MKLLRSINKLEELSKRENIVQVLGFIHTLKLFEDVVKECFGKNLESEAKIWNFEQSNVSLPVSVIPKVHAEFHHVPQFIKMKKTGLGLFTEQATEALHSNFKGYLNCVSLRTWTDTNEILHTQNMQVNCSNVSSNKTAKESKSQTPIRIFFEKLS